jgi:hypothetical protein
MLQTFPNYYVLGPNIKFMAAHGVRGVFEECGGAAGDGTDGKPTVILKFFLM